MVSTRYQTQALFGGEMGPSYGFMTLFARCGWVGDYFEPDVLASAPPLNLPFSPVQSGQVSTRYQTQALFRGEMGPSYGFMTLFAHNFGGNNIHMLLFVLLKLRVVLLRDLAQVPAHRCDGSRANPAPAILVVQIVHHPHGSRLRTFGAVGWASLL